MRVEKIAIINNVQNNNTREKTVDFPPVKEETKEINLNQDPKAIAFQGLFFNKKKPAPKPVTTQPVINEPKIYGPYKLTASQIASNNEDAEYFVGLITKILKKENANTGDSYNHTLNRAKNSDIKKTANLAISCLCYYPKSATSFPLFHDSMTRAFPKACIVADKKNNNDNATRIYQEVMKQTEAIGKIIDPDGNEPIKSGITYLYFADNLPAFKLADDEDSAKDTIEKMEKGIRPELCIKKSYPRCHMSTVPNEIRIYGNNFIQDKFGEIEMTETTKRVTNKFGREYNINYKSKPKPKTETEAETTTTYEPYNEPIDLEAFVGEMLRGIF